MIAKAASKRRGSRRPSSARPRAKHRGERARRSPSRARPNPYEAIDVRHQARDQRVGFQEHMRESVPCDRIAATCRPMK